MGFLKPAREQSSQDDVICDLDVVTTRRATFTFGGKSHVLLPITNQVFVDFWEAVQAYKKMDHVDAKSADKAYFTTIKILCPSVTLKEVEAMTLIQKSILIEGLASRVLGKKPEPSDLKKKATQFLG
jgi:hypothetical protein